MVSRRRSHNLKHAQPDGEPQQDRSRWPLVLFTLGCAVIGIVVLERLSRPPELPQAKARPTTPLAAEAVSAAPAAAAIPSAARKPATPVPPVDLKPVPTTVQEAVDEAFTYADDLAHAFPKSTTAWNVAGSVYQEFHEPQRALNCADEALKIDPNCVQAWYNKGIIAWGLGDLPQAIEQFQKVYQNSPDLPGTRFYLGDALVNTGQFRDAVKVMEKATNLGNCGAVGPFALGRAYFEIGELENARKQFEACLALDPNFPPAHFSLFKVFTQLGDREKAKQHRETFAKLHAQGLDKARGLPMGRETDLANVRYRFGRSLQTIAEVYEEQGQVHEAMRVLRRAIKVSPEDRELGRALVAMSSPRPVASPRLPQVPDSAMSGRAR